jgi:predicted negative regulator of RcsB-dependent stress response
LTEYLTEQEQVTLLKTWLKRYGLTILAGILLAALFTTGWRAWQQHRNKVLLHASAVYDEMLTARAQSNTGEAVVQAQKLLNHYSHTPYAEMAALLLARDAVLKKNYPEAIHQLDWVMRKANSKAIRQIARLRQARILITLNKSKEALALLDKINDKTFIGLIDEIRGDALLALNDKIAARKAYEKALSELPNAEVMRPLLQMKFENLASLGQTNQPL